MNLLLLNHDKTGELYKLSIAQLQDYLEIKNPDITVATVKLEPHRKLHGLSDALLLKFKQDQVAVIDCSSSETIEEGVTDFNGLAMAYICEFADMSDTSRIQEGWEVFEDGIDV